jgi:hypothetical protein
MHAIIKGHKSLGPHKISHEMDHKVIFPQKNNIPHFLNQRYIKGIDRPFGGGVESILIRSVFVNWRLGKFFLSHFKWPSSQDQQKTIVHRLITPEVTLTGQSHFMLIFVLRKATLPNRINSVP